MAKYRIGCKVSIYYDVEVEADDEWDANEKALEQFGNMLDDVDLPTPLEFDGLEVWDTEKE